MKFLFNKTAIKALTDRGAKRWTKAGHDRLYIENVGREILAADIDYYNAGNICGALFLGGRVSNAAAGRIFLALNQGYIDLLTGDLVMRKCEEYVKSDGEDDNYVDIREKVTQGIQTIIAQANYDAAQVRDYINGHTEDMTTPRGDAPARIRAARRNHGITQEALGVALGYEPAIAQRIVARWEAGTRPVPMDKIKRLAELLHIDVVLLLP